MFWAGVLHTNLYILERIIILYNRGFTMMKNTFVAHGFTRKSGDRFVLINDSIYISVYKYKDNRYAITAKTAKKGIRMPYLHVTDPASMFDDMASTIKSKLGVDILAPSPDTPIAAVAKKAGRKARRIKDKAAEADTHKPTAPIQQELPMPAEMDIPTPPAEAPTIEPVQTFASPESVPDPPAPEDNTVEPEYVPLPIEADLGEPLDPPAPEPAIEFKAPSAELSKEAENVEAETLARSHEREFNPLNAKQDFPLTSNLSLPPSDAPDEVSKGLMSEVRDKDGKTEIGQVYGTKKERNWPLIIGVATGAFILGFLLMRSKQSAANQPPVQ